MTAAPQGNIVVPPGPGAGQPTQPPAPQARAAPAEPAPPLVDPDTVAALAPAALSAGTMAMGMLPMLASALAGLGSGSGGSGSGSGTGSGADSGGADGSEGGLSPEAQKALQALKLLAAVYGDGKTDDPEVKQLRQQMGINGSGSGATAIKARQLFQKNAATAFNNLDNQLASYITGLAGNHTVDKKAVTALIREVNVALAELGPQAYTKAGRQKVHQILTTALQKASQIVTGSNATASTTANAINRLTNQYLYNIAGKKYTGGTSSQMPGGTVGDWINQALQVLQQLGYNISTIDPQAIAIIIQHESGGNPSATNNYDSNAAAGTPSIGLMQTIGPTFNQYAASGHTNIYNPVDNIVAGVRYAISRYGSVSNVPGVKAVRSGRAYEPY
ncbi:transglycosylase SLT domain-containing protein [Nocardia sp. CA-107356]|uniref:transglycosylase SLT domain-containing protein n=1 Tax=Nocardia sp. CA-107356 TaxID=3239972 RepID=UPI003D8B4063